MTETTTTAEDVNPFLAYLLGPCGYPYARLIGDGRFAALAILFGGRGRIVVGQVGDYSGYDVGY